MIRKGYSDGPFGQVHWRMIDSRGRRIQPDLYCLHPAPFSSLAYTAIMPELAAGRRVIAPDFPGYGGSDPGALEPAIADYAEAMIAVMADLSPVDPIDLTGFHTGNLVATDIAEKAPDRVRRLALVDIPAFDPATRDKYHAMAARPFVISPDLDSLAQPWERGITKRWDSQSPERCFAMFTEQLRPGKYMHSAFHAAFTYDIEQHLPRVSHPTLAIATKSMLHDATRYAAELIPGARLVERPDITRAVLDEAADITAAAIRAFLEEDLS